MSAIRTLDSAGETEEWMNAKEVLASLSRLESLIAQSEDAESGYTEIEPIDGYGELVGLDEKLSNPHEMNMMVSILSFPTYHLAAIEISLDFFNIILTLIIKFVFSGSTFGYYCWKMHL